MNPSAVAFESEHHHHHHHQKPDEEEEGGRRYPVQGRRSQHEDERRSDASASVASFNPHETNNIRQHLTSGLSESNKFYMSSLLNLPSNNAERMPSCQRGDLYRHHMTTPLHRSRPDGSPTYVSEHTIPQGKLVQKKYLNSFAPISQANYRIAIDDSYEICRKSPRGRR